MNQLPNKSCGFTSGSGPEHIVLYIITHGITTWAYHWSVNPDKSLQGSLRDAKDLSSKRANPFAMDCFVPSGSFIQASRSCAYYNMILT